MLTGKDCAPGFQIKNSKLVRSGGYQISTSPYVKKT